MVNTAAAGCGAHPQDPSTRDTEARGPSSVLILTTDQVQHPAVSYMRPSTLETEAGDYKLEANLGYIMGTFLKPIKAENALLQSILTGGSWLLGRKGFGGRQVKGIGREVGEVRWRVGDP